MRQHQTTPPIRTDARASTVSKLYLKTRSCMVWHALVCLCVAGARETAETAAEEEKQKKAEQAATAAFEAQVRVRLRIIVGHLETMHG